MHRVPSEMSGAALGAMPSSVWACVRTDMATRTTPWHPIGSIPTRSIPMAQRAERG